MIKNKKLNIAIVGLGNIGLNLYEHLIKNKKAIKERTPRQNLKRTFIQSNPKNSTKRKSRRNNKQNNRITHNF